MAVAPKVSNSAFIKPSRTVGWNRTVKLSVGPKFTGEMETDSINHSMPSPAFVHELGRRNIPINYGVEDLRQDLSSLGEVCSSD